MMIRRSDARANQARVLEAARQIFAEQGLAAEVKDIAQRAGVGVATIYRGFGSKQELLLATVEGAKAELTQLLNEAEGSSDVVEGMRSLITGMLGFAESYGWLIQASFQSNGLDELKSSMKSAHDSPERVVRLMERGVAEGVFLENLPVDVVLILIEGAVMALTFRVQKQKPHPSFAAIADGIVGMMTGARTATAASQV